MADTKDAGSMGCRGGSLLSALGSGHFEHKLGDQLLAAAEPFGNVGLAKPRHRNAAACTARSAMAGGSGNSPLDAPNPRRTALARLGIVAARGRSRSLLALAARQRAGETHRAWVGTGERVSDSLPRHQSFWLFGANVR